MLRQEWDICHQHTIDFHNNLAATGDSTGISQATYEAEASYRRYTNVEALLILYERMLGLTE